MTKTWTKRGLLLCSLSSISIVATFDLPANSRGENAGNLGLISGHQEREETLLGLPHGQGSSVENGLFSMTGSDEVLKRSKREVELFNGEHPLVYLLKFRDRHYLSDQQSRFIKTNYPDIENFALLRVKSTFLWCDENGTTIGNSTFIEDTEVQNSTVSDFVKTLLVDDFSSVAVGEPIVFTDSLFDTGNINSMNETLYELAVVIRAASTADAVISKINSTKFIDGYQRFTSNASHTLNFGLTSEETYSKIEEYTVCQAFIRLEELDYMPQFTDMGNAATQQITNQMLLLTRPLMRIKFGEYYFRSVVLGYYSVPRYGQTVVNVAFLLEANDYNVVDANAVFTAQAEEQGVLGLYTLTPDSFSVYQLDYVPEDFKTFLVADETRAQRISYPQEFIKAILLPSYLGMLAFVLAIMLCSCDGLFCKIVFEDQTCCASLVYSKEKY